MRCLTVCLGLALLLGLPQAGWNQKKTRQWHQKSDHPLTMFHWRGPGSGPDQVSGKMAGSRQDRVIAPEKPKRADLPDLTRADIVSIRNHGGCLQTYDPGDLWKDNTLLFGSKPGEVRAPGTTIRLPIDDDRGPSVVLAWGCHNGRTARQGDRFPNALGVRCDSTRKAYVAPTWNAQARGDTATFQTKFFEEFSRGDVSIEEAARRAYAAARAEAFNPEQYSDFEKDIDICGNRFLTMDDVRENVEKRSQARGPAPSPTPGGPASSTRYVSTSAKSTGRYCTNNPRIQSAMPVSPVVTKTAPRKR